LQDLGAEKLVLMLREQAVLRSTPIVVLGRDGSPSDRARFMWAGANAYLTKPLIIAQIEQTIQELLDTQGRG
jgi:DNA-binding response OmpR family regulator